MVHAFSFKDIIKDVLRYFALDVESGAIHELDSEAFSIIKAQEEGRDVSSTGLSYDKINEILQELDELKKEGLLYTLPYDYTLPQQDEPLVIKSLCLHIAHDCNLRCKYCFAGAGEYGGSSMLMPFEVGKKAIDFLFANSGNRKNLEVDFFGGEPLINFDVVKAIVEYARGLEKQKNKKINFTITTNGISLDDNSIDYINKEMFNVVLSLDGRKEVHDYMRKTINGKGSYDIAKSNIKKLIEKRKGEYYVRGTFTSKNLDFTKDVKALYDEGFRHISLEPVVLDNASPYAIRMEHIEAIYKEYDNLASFYVKNLEENKWFNYFHFMLDMENGPCLKKRIKGCGAGVEYIAITPDGSIYPCHQFAGEESFNMGNILKGTFNAGKRRVFLNSTLLNKDDCKACWAKYFCSGGCAANAWKFNGDIKKPEKISCLLLKKRTECAIGIAMAKKTKGEVE